MTIEIEKHKWLPCSLKVFMINGIAADSDDFGTSEKDGSPMRGTCHSEFIHGYPTQEVLSKYGITLEEFREICEKLEEELYVWACGLCW